MMTKKAVKTTPMKSTTKMPVDTPASNQKGLGVVMLNGAKSRRSRLVAPPDGTVPAPHTNRHALLAMNVLWARARSSACPFDEERALIWSQTAA